MELAGLHASSMVEPHSDCGMGLDGGVWAWTQFRGRLPLIETDQTRYNHDKVHLNDYGFGHRQGAGGTADGDDVTIARRSKRYEAEVDRMRQYVLFASNEGGTQKGK